MKKLFAIILFLAFFTNSAYSFRYSEIFQDSLLSENFENWSVTSADWQIFDSNGDNLTWSIYGNAGVDGSFAAGYLFSFTEIADDWIISKGISLEAGKNYWLNFKYRIEDELYPEKLAVYFGLFQNPMSMTTEIVDLGEIKNEQFLTLSRGFTVPADSVYYFGWYAYSDPYQWVVLIDNIYIKEIDCSASVPPVIELGNDQSLCEGDTIVLSVESEFDLYVWGDYGNLPNLTVTQSGIYSLYVEDSCLNSAFDNVEINYIPNPEIDLGNDTTIVEGDNILLSTGVSNMDYLWSTNETSQSILISEHGTYYVTVTNDSNCFSVDSINIYYLGIENPFSKIQIFPQPTVDFLNISSGNEIIVEIEIFDSNAKTVFYKEAFLQNLIIDVSVLKTGEYIAKIKTKSNRLYSKIIVKI
ncbi:MAG: T9SS type A sorting domain-containing protein [Bacteroidetes bacterium]|jgi:hypothetical protein|nr:T9SS type A sorting domain-containing protein [Bacteroidota bacterium]MBT6685134.1 T9SS type A sorting domain-containing protein [Bacteroidota bacterium]MBT7142045.1 T9SS type A sorting domain-containing protein [Bacteroidota bacterium]MBT7493367.1 T9SS type A sorting domain-containing protein [Bacteroidota bacterium]